MFFFFVFLQKGRQPFLTQLLVLYKVFRPDLVMLSLPARVRVSVFFYCFLQQNTMFQTLRLQFFFLVLQTGFKNHNSTWKVALSAVQRKNKGAVLVDQSLSLDVKEKPSSRKRVICLQRNAVKSFTEL